MDRRGRHLQRVGGLRDRDGLAVRLWLGCDRDPRSLTNTLDPCGGEWQPGPGAPSLPVQDRGDLLVGVMRGEPADQLDRVLRCAGSLRAAADQPDGQLAARPALPEDLDLGDVLRSADGDDDLADQRPQQLLAVTVGGRVRCPQLREVAREAGQRVPLSRGEWRGPGVLQRRERALLPCDTLV